MARHQPPWRVRVSARSARWCRTACPTILLALAACTAREAAHSPPSRDCCLTVPPSAPDASLLDTVDRDVARAFHLLSNTMVFQEAHVGFAGALSENVRAFRRIRSSPHARTLFVDLAREATVVGRLYGAIGLRALDTEAFDEAVEALRALGSHHVLVHAGCDHDSIPLDLLLENDSPGAIRVVPGHDGEGSMVIGTGVNDVVGGGFGSSFERD